MLYWLRVLANLLASGGGATTATPLSSTAKGYEDAHIDCSQDGQQNHGKPRSDLHGRVQSSLAYMYMLRVSLFIRCTVRCEIWAQPAELPW